MKKKNIKEGFNRLSLTAGCIGAIIFGFLGWGWASYPEAVIGNVIFNGAIGFFIGYLIARLFLHLIEWIVKGFLK